MAPTLTLFTDNADKANDLKLLIERALSSVESSVASLLTSQCFS